MQWVTLEYTIDGQTKICLVYGHVVGTCEHGNEDEGLRKIVENFCTSWKIDSLQNLLYEISCHPAISGWNEYEPECYVYWTVHHLDSWVKWDQLDVTCFIISSFNVLHVSDVNTSILRSLRFICWVISWVVLLWFDVCWCYIVVWLWWCGICMQVEALLAHLQNFSLHRFVKLL